MSELPRNLPDPLTANLGSTEVCLREAPPHFDAPPEEERAGITITDRARKAA